MDAVAHRTERCHRVAAPIGKDKEHDYSNST